MYNCPYPPVLLDKCRIKHKIASQNENVCGMCALIYIHMLPSVPLDYMQGIDNLALLYIIQLN